MPFNSDAYIKRILSEGHFKTNPAFFKRVLAYREKVKQWMVDKFGNKLVALPEDTGSFYNRTAINSNYDLDIVLPFKKNSYSSLEEMYHDVYEKVGKNNAQNVTATFTLDQFTLTVNKADDGAGLVTSTPAGINCGSTCSALFNGGTMVTLTAAALTGSTFTVWSGGGCSGTGYCITTMNIAQNVKATFALNIYQLTVIKTGAGTGTVISSPEGINCGGTCNANYNSGIMVTLTATPALGSTFTGWSGGGCSGMGTCVYYLHI